VNVIRHVEFRGRVQGVGFRAFVEEVASRNGIEGWVRNRRAGSVEAVFSGAAGTIESVIAVCSRGPRQAEVDAVDQRNATTDDLALRGREPFAMLPTV
jgi:acylphosphatase